MRLVLDPEWDVCYIEVTEAESQILKWPPLKSSEEIKADTIAILAGVPPEALPGYKAPEGYQALVDRAYELRKIAWPFEREIAKRRLTTPEIMLCGIEARVVG